MGKNLSDWAIEICQNQGSISSPFFRKDTITFCKICAGLSGLAAFLGPTPTFLKNDLRYLM